MRKKSMDNFKCHKNNKGQLSYWALVSILACQISCSFPRYSFEHIDEVLNRQQNAWNRGDIEDFMKGYWHSDQLSFGGARGLSQGWEQVLDNYQKAYPNKEAMGQLTFQIMERHLLGKKSAVYFGRYSLRKHEDAFGYFTIIWKKINGEWKIIHDHTSLGIPQEE